MKKIILALLILIFLASLSVFADKDIFANADSVIEITSITCIDKDGEDADYIPGRYARDININVALTSPNLKVQIYENVGAVYQLRREYTVSASGGVHTVDVNESGELKVVLTAQDEGGTGTGVLETTVFSDNYNPPSPVIDTEELLIYHVSPFNLPYRLNRDIDSGLDFTRCKYRYVGTDGETVFETAIIYESYDTKLIPIDRNGILYFELYDEAGNHAVYTFTYSRYGYPESDAPVISGDPATGYAQSVTVSISWGEEYDNHPYARKEYSITTAGAPLNKEYTGPFVIDTEGEYIITAYYYQGGQKKSVSKTIKNIDRTPPLRQTLVDSATVYCDLTADTPIYMSVRAHDSISGIKRVYLLTGEEFVNYSANLYKVDIFGKTSFTIVAEDNAGNTQQYSILNMSYDYVTVSEYSQIFKELNPDDYTEAGWEKVEAAIRDLGLYLITNGATPSKISEKKRAVDAAIEGKVNIISRVNEIPTGLSGMFTFDFTAESLGLKKGSDARIILDKITDQTNEEVKAKLDAIKAAAGFSSAVTFTFCLYAEDMDANALSLLSPASFTLTLPDNVSAAKIYRYQNGTLLEVTSLFSGGELTVITETLGNFYIAAQSAEEEKPEKGFIINGKFYSWNMVSIAAAVIVGGIGLTIVIVKLVNRKRA